MKKITILLSALALSLCLLAGCGPQGGFVNPGDYLGGGGTGDAAEGADDVTDEVKEDFSDEDLSELSENTSKAGAVLATPTEGVYTISEGGTYLFQGAYGGIAFGAKNLNLHLIFDGAEIVTAEGIALDGKTNQGANAALDADRGIVIDGGYLFAVGPIGMVETPATNSKQNVLSYAQNQAIAANTVLSLTDEEGTPIFSVTVKKNCQSVIVSCPELALGKPFKLYGGDTELCAFTVSSVITSVGSQGNMGNPGGMPPGGFGGGFGGGKGPGGR